MKDQERNHIANFNAFCKLMRAYLKFGDIPDDQIQDWFHECYIMYREQTMEPAALKWILFHCADLTMDSHNIELK